MVESVARLRGNSTDLKGTGAKCLAAKALGVTVRDMCLTS